MSTRSKLAHDNIKPVKSNYKSRIYDFLGSDGAYLQDVIESLKMRHQTASARLSELADDGLVYQNTLGKYFITPTDMVSKFRYEREREKYEKWKSLGERNDWFNFESKII